jgi:hypothetical protein
MNPAMGELKPKTQLEYTNCDPEVKRNLMIADIKNQWGFSFSERKLGGADFPEKFFELVFFKTRDGNLKFLQFANPEYCVR